MRRMGWILGLAAMPCLTSCSTTAAVLAIPAIDRAVEREQGRRATDVSNLPANGQIKIDNQKTWRRFWRDSQGRALSADRYSPGDMITIVWSIPFGVADKTGGVAIFTENACQASRAEPSAVRAIYGADARVSPEVWHTGTGPGRQLSYVGALRILGNRGQARDFPKWLIITPKEGDYRLEMMWRDTSLVQLQNIRPCIQAWGAVDMATAIGATSATDTRPASRAAAVPQVTQALEIDIESQELLGLTGDPQFDLPKLHDLALDVEFGGIGLDERAETAAKDSRKITLAKLLQNTTGRQNLCRMILRYRLDARPMKLWGRQPTVEASHLRAGGCERSPERLNMSRTPK